MKLFRQDKDFFYLSNILLSRCGLFLFRAFIRALKNFADEKKSKLKNNRETQMTKINFHFSKKPTKKAAIKHFKLILGVAG
jgi:hypothetical protein